jgi:sulfoxide reductase heme-binding subunit YedZ
VPSSGLRRIRRIQATAVALIAAPLGALVAGYFGDDLGANPVERITHVTGEWTLRFLFVALAITPLRRLAGWRWAAPLRRTFGLAAFGYGCLHALTFFWLDHFFDWAGIWEDVLERRYVTAGLAALLCMAPLAATSTRAMARRLGRRWKTLHRLAYAAGVLGVIHFLWLVKADLLQPAIYALVLAALFGARIYLRLRAAPRKRAECYVPEPEEVA